MQFIVDSRERSPYPLPGFICKPLVAGDYTIEGFEKVIALERKTHDDLFGCLAARRAHFVHQLKKLQAFPYRAIIVDSTPDAILFGHAYSNLPGEVALARLTMLSLEYSVPVIFAGQSLGALLARNWLVYASTEAKKHVQA